MSSSSNSGGGGGGAPAGGGGAPAGGGGAPAGGGGGDDSPAACSGVGPVRVRVFRFFGRRSSTSQPSLSRPGQEGHDSDQDSTDSDENNKYAGSLSGSGMPCREARDRDSPCRGPNRRARSKKQSGSAASSVSSDCNGSSSSGDCFRSVSSNSQLTGSSSDSSSSNGDNSPGFGCGSACTPTVMGLEGGTSSDSGSGGSSGSEFGGTVRVFQTCLRPLTSLGAPAPSSSGYSSGSSSGSSSGRSNSCCCEACDSTLHKMFHTLSLSTLALTTLAPLGHRSSSCLSMGDAQHRQFHRNQHRHHHYLHHHTAYTLKETDAPSLPVPSPPTPVAKQDKDSKGHGKAPARILRSPVSYTYVRGISGLPTQRIPRHRLAPGPGSGAASKRPRSSPGHGHGHGHGLDGLSRHAYNS